mmetsp:Transcript_34693/g.104806  ORF Transcript_34693/g.104806 Transcript_34693/m.104806 type:complete len:308 (-) Transcript_34693:1160-2083(-)
MGAVSGFRQAHLLDARGGAAVGDEHTLKAVQQLQLGHGALVLPLPGGRALWQGREGLGGPAHSPRGPVQRPHPHGRPPRPPVLHTDARGAPVRRGLYPHRLAGPCEPFPADELVQPVLELHDEVAQVSRRFLDPGRGHPGAGEADGRVHGGASSHGDLRPAGGPRVLRISQGALRRGQVDGDARAHGALRRGAGRRAEECARQAEHARDLADRPRPGRVLALRAHRVVLAAPAGAGRLLGLLQGDRKSAERSRDGTVEQHVRWQYAGAAGRRHARRLQRDQRHRGPHVLRRVRDLHPHLQGDQHAVH